MAGYNKRVLLAYGVGVLAFIAAINTSIFIPCVFKLIFDIPCPGCGLFRAGIYISRFDFVNAFKMNILVLPLMAGVAAHFTCTLIDAFSNKRAATRLNALLMNKWIVAAAVLLMLASWYYNIVRGI
ncbi:MAG: DUF2752 domain-containing protein [Defluviitaleaceae bacterium]|nr:DUF2752 domain-containing protein [Defluviitaleaceae bacterium]